MQTRYEAPTTVADAVQVLTGDAGARILAGGTDLLVQYHAGVRRPSVFVDVKRIPELMRIDMAADSVTIGAAVPAADIAAHPVIATRLPGLAEAVRLIGSTQIQARGSLGGNLCNGSPAADSTCALLVNQAEAIVAGPTGERRVAVDAFTLGPGRTVLAPGELLVALRVPLPAPGTADAYLRLIPRSEMDIAVASAGVSVTRNEAGVCTAARVAIGAVAPTARLVPAAAAALVGSTLDQVALNRAAAAAREAAAPISDKRGTAAYRTTVAGVLARRAAAIAGQRAGRR